MSWEPFDAWPGEASGGAFRGASEPVLAKRDGLTLRQKLALFWRSSPDLPAARVAIRVALTAAHVYVERRDGSRERVARERLRGVRREGPVMVFGVLEAEDLFVPDRAACGVQRALWQQLQRERPHRDRRGVVEAALLTAVAGTASVALFTQYSVHRALAHLEAGLWTSENVLGALAALVAALVTLACTLWVPSWTQVDATGVERRRGLVPWLVFRRPPEDFEAVGVRAMTGHRQRATVLVGYRAVLVLRAPARFGTLQKVREVQVGFVRALEGQPPAEADARAREIAQNVRALLEL